MFQSPVLSTLAAIAIAGFVLFAAILIGPDFARAEPTADASRPMPRSMDLKASLDIADEIAALEALQITLSEVGDGSTFVWYRANGRLSGVFQPTTSFKSDAGKVCRHLRMMLTSGAVSRKAEGVACRGDNGVWSLEG